ncbi:MAG: hypothetical protein AAGK04_04570 [Planctomycetota bacterium]
MVPVLALIGLAPIRGRGAYDMLRFHVPAIERFAGQLPSPDLTDYLSATTPGYHLALALVASVTGGLAPLRLAGAACTLLFAILLGWALGRRAEAWKAVTLGAPAVASSYVVLSGAFVLPDVAGWLGVLAVLVIALRAAEGRATCGRWLAMGGMALLGLAFVRQIHLWAAAALWTGAWWSLGGGRLLDGLTTDLGARVRRAVTMLVATLPAFAMVGAFVALWGGLTPPMFQGQYPPGVSLAGPAFVLALVGAIGLFFLGWWWPMLTSSLAASPGANRGPAWLGAAGAVLGAGVVAIAVATDYDKDAGRWTGLWNVAQRLPAPGGRSVVIVGLAMLGGLTIWSVVRPLSAPIRWTLLAAGLAFVVAFSAGHELWQRYAEPFVLLWLALALAHTGCHPDSAGRSVIGVGLGVWRLAGPALFVVGSLVLAGAQVWRAPPLGEIDPDAPLPWTTPPPPDPLGAAPYAPRSDVPGANPLGSAS